MNPKRSFQKPTASSEKPKQKRQRENSEPSIVVKKAKGKATKKKDRRSERHIRYQARLASILRERGFNLVKVEHRVPYYLPLSLPNAHPLKIRYRLDVYGKSRDRVVGIEIDGYMGHKSWRAHAMDELRTRRLQEAYAPLKIYRFTFKTLAAWTDEEIAAEMRL